MILAGKKKIKEKEQSAFWRNFHRYWDLLSVLVPQNLNTRYRGSYLGVYWSLLNPIIMTGLYTTIFGSTFASYYNDSLISYILAAFTGLLVINFYNSSTTQALSSIVVNGDLLNKIKLPIPVFPLSMIAANIFQFMISSFPLLAIVTLVNSKNPLYIFLLLIPFFSLVLVCTGVGLFVSALFVFFRDLGYFYEITTFVMWITSPVFYPAEIVPPRIQPILGLNPLVSIIESLRDISLMGNIPSAMLLFKGILAGVIILTLGILFFRKFESAFMDLL
ncbi:ABC transporter permease [Cyanobacterium aponinum AL20118]|uniref:Transport permease protein n=3 Tax=Cyanobacterium aponinum TaxID=379064 RepID=K9Z2V0_CYAAP|nr:ABC transporter permease [Cyanobacterium aponinum]AFZ53484.1 ABC-2 type transporter [Cyanobacterium aponinum PCC 10605]MBD2393352.1 ABC transporter permease [Cyanobacterium aponinum FACHB-4101]MTF38511.1 ABC transporter permease [Cyanobacterium aponinum 0216]PHV63447.1 ABC transporter permease [Cyanobacterium aponinum IPPAS B-1201]WPF89834.1 ABC transporter permease [Cyanobacterium aponinum AL20115]